MPPVILKTFDMNPLESQLEYPFGDAMPEPGAVHEVAPGVLWLRMGLPFALNHVNLWLLEDEYAGEHGSQRGWTVVDSGISNETTQACWESIFAGRLRGMPIVRLIATHCHPDHVGLAHWLCERWNAPLWMTAGEYAFARMMSANLPGVEGDAMLQHFARHGALDAAMQDKLQQRKSHYHTLVPALPPAYRRMHEDQAIAIGGRQWRVITGFGHAPEHASLYCASLKLLISGDMVLPRISTNVSVSAVEPESNPVQLYLDSLAKFRDLPQDTLVLPSHGKPFRGLHTRIAQLNEHHAARLAEVAEACATPQSAADIVPVMFKRELDGHQMMFALGEALAHLNKLWFDGVLARRTGADGIIRFSLK
jgi:glyoxylase-like metal-dependent hydrolase (beta-lactamase superfamily II)